jgi:hypothetical protein
MAWRRGQAYGQDLRERVLGAAGLSLRAAAARFAVSPSYVAKVRARLRDTGERRPGRNATTSRPGWRRSRTRCGRGWRAGPTRPWPSCAPGRWPSTGCGSASR